MGQIDIELAKLKETKASIAQSITAKGGVLTNPSDFSSYSTAVTSIPNTVTDFSVIGYDSVPEPFNSGIEYAKQIKDNWDGSAMGIGKYKDNKQLIFFPVVDTSATISGSMLFQNSSLSATPLLNTQNFTTFANMFRGTPALVYDISSYDTTALTQTSYMFAECDNLIKIIFPSQWKIVQQMDHMFDGCKSLTDISNIPACKEAVNMSYMFRGCKSLTTIPDLGETAKVEGMKGIFGASGIVRVEGMNINIVKAEQYANYWVDDYGEVPSLRYMFLRRLGSLNNTTTYNFAAFPNWGVNNTANPDAKQSLLDTLAGAPDRTGYNTCTVKLAQTTLNVLTDEEKTAFTSKNYVLAVGTMYD